MDMNVDNFTYGMVDGREGFSSSLGTICQLRYQVYVNEWGFEKPEDHSGGLERDEYDQHSIHFYACSSDSDDVIGAARIILGSERSLPIERHFDISQFPAGVRREQAAEISRLAISKKFRCRAIDRAILRTEKTAANHLRPVMEKGRHFRLHYEQELVRGRLDPNDDEHHRQGQAQQVHDIPAQALRARAPPHAQPGQADRDRRGPDRLGGPAQHQ